MLVDPWIKNDQRYPDRVVVHQPLTCHLSLTQKIAVVSHPNNDGIVFKIVKIEVEPSETGGNSLKDYYNNDAFLDSDDEDDDEVDEVKEVVSNMNMDDDSDSSDSDSDSDDEEAVAKKKKSKSKKT